MSQLGTVLPRRPVAWFWVAVSTVAAAYLCWRALASGGSWLWPLLLAAVAILVAIEPWLRKRDIETVQVDDSGVVRIDGDNWEGITWADVREIRIITTDQGPFVEDVFFVLIGADGNGCVIPHDAAERTKLLEVLQSRFDGLADDEVIRAMGSTSNNDFVIWRAHDTAA